MTPLNRMWGVDGDQFRATARVPVAGPPGQQAGGWRCGSAAVASDGCVAATERAVPAGRGERAGSGR
jgi:hypothetical protein